MTGLNVDGLVSGLSTSDLVSKLIEAERGPQSALKTKQTKLQRLISSLQSLNTKLTGISTATKSLTGDLLLSATGWQQVSASSSDSSRVAVSATAGAATGSMSFSVSQLATASAAVSTGTVTATSSTVTSATSLVLTKGATSTTINLSGGTLADVVSAVNAAGAGVSAAAVQTATGQYRLQLTSTTTGAASTVGLTDSGGANPFASSSLGGLSVLTAAADTQLQVGTGPGAYTVTRSSNTISDLLPGATLTLLKADPASTVTVGVTADAGAVADQVGKLVDAVNGALGQIKLDSSYNSTTKTGGALLGNSLVSSLQQRLVAAATGAVAGNALGSPAMAGVSVTRDGSLQFDRTKFLDAYAKNPSAVQGLLGAGSTGAPGVAARLAEIVKAATDVAAGSVTTNITSQQNQVRALDSQIASWDTRLAVREKSLRDQFTAMETALGQMRSQSQWLAGQISSLSGLSAS